MTTSFSISICSQLQIQKKNTTKFNNIKNKKKQLIFNSLCGRRGGSRLIYNIVYAKILVCYEIGDAGSGAGSQIVRQTVPSQIAVPSEDFTARGTIVGLDIGVR